MISASFSLSLPRLGWKSTSTPRSLKICTAAGDSASEMRTFGLAIVFSLRHSRARAPRGDPESGRDCEVLEQIPGSRLAPRNDGLRRFRQRRLHLGEGPVDPLREQCDVASLHSGAAPDAQARRRVAVM